MFLGRQRNMFVGFRSSCITLIRAWRFHGVLFDYQEVGLLVQQIRLMGDEQLFRYSGWFKESARLTCSERTWLFEAHLQQKANIPDSPCFAAITSVEALRPD